MSQRDSDLTTATKAGCSDRPPAANCCPAPGEPAPLQRIPLFTPSAPESCCPPGPAFAYRSWSFVCGQLDTPLGQFPRVATTISAADRSGRWQMRWGFGRDRYRVEPEIYAVGNPGPTSPVLVSANYKLSFDALRAELGGLDLWILVIDTKGINVWCAAGKGTFGTAEIIRRVQQTNLAQLVSHRSLLLPQLGAPGVAAHEVKRGCGFGVVYGPVRAADIKAFLAAGQVATAAMRRVTFGTQERLILTPVEVTVMGKTVLKVAALLLVLGGIGPALFSLDAVLHRGGPAVLVGLAGLLAGGVLTPVLLPWLPGRAFALKGALCGGVFAVLALLLFGHPMSLGNRLALLLTLPAVASYCAMDFTGSSTFTSPSGVEKEMRRAIPCQAGALLVAAVAWLAAAF